eukprot:s321_g39.t1
MVESFVDFAGFPFARPRIVRLLVLVAAAKVEVDHAGDGQNFDPNSFLQIRLEVKPAENPESRKLASLLLLAREEGLKAAGVVGRHRTSWTTFPFS